MRSIGIILNLKEPLAQSPSHRILAIRRGEKEGFLIMDISIDKEIANEELKRVFIKSSSHSSKEVSTAIEDSFHRLLKPSIETEFRLASKNKADEEAIKSIRRKSSSIIAGFTIRP